MEPVIAVSTTAFQSDDLNEIVTLSARNSINAVELSGNLNYIPETELLSLIESNKDVIDFFFHNYAPVPKKPFVLNLAHPNTMERSIEHCRQTISFCQKMRSNVFSIHAGMAFSPSPGHLGQYQSDYKSIPIAESRRLLKKGLLGIADFAMARDVTILIENNVVAGFNSQNGRNDRYHLADLSDASEFLEVLSHPNIGILLDVGHLKVSAVSLDFKCDDFFSVYSHKIKALHLSENDGTADQNHPIQKDSWFWEYVPWSDIKYVSLEIRPQHIDFIKEQIKLVNSMMP